MLANIILETIGVTLAAKIVRIELSLLWSLLIVSLSAFAVHILPTPINFITSIVLFFTLIKRVDGSCSGYRILGLIVVSVAFQQAIINHLLLPLITHQI